MEDPKQVVRRGYDALSHRYDNATNATSKYQSWTNDLITRLAPASRVLDVGCGSGVPVARALSAAGHHVVGVDISEVQISRARELVPQAEFINADAMSLDFPPESFDAVVSLYALIHLPLDEQQQLLARIATWLRPGGASSVQRATLPGPAPTTTGSTAAHRCGGATPTQRRTAAGWPTPVWS